MSGGSAPQRGSGGSAHGASEPRCLLCPPCPAPQAEYERVKAAYTDMSASLESLSAEKRRLEAQLAQMDADGRRSERERRSLEQQVSRAGWQGGLEWLGGGVMDQLPHVDVANTAC